MKIYLSWYADKNGYIDVWNIKYWLNTFPEMYKRKDLPTLITKVKDMFLDSWGFSIRIRWIKLNVWDYVKYIKARWYKYQAIANMDTADVKETIENQKILEWETWFTILPVYHQSDFKEWNIKMLEDYCSKYDYIALWWMAGTKWWKKEQELFLYTCFNIAKQTNTKIHWFWITSDTILWKFPFYSVDSTSRLEWVKYMQVSYFKNWKMKTYAADKMRKELGIDLSKISYGGRLQRNLDSRLKYNDYITTLHQVKGMEYWL